MALSLRSPSPAVSRHRIPVEPGLSSMAVCTPTAAVQPSGSTLMRRPAHRVNVKMLGVGDAGSSHAGDGHAHRLQAVGIQATARRWVGHRDDMGGL